MLKKAIFGGTFDPIHIGHMNVAYEALYTLKLDEVIFMPSGIPPHKAFSHITDFNYRYEMLKLATENEKKFFVSCFEMEQKGISYTYKTINYFHNNNENTKWYLIVGTDCLMNIETWKNVEEILKKCTLAVFNRPGYDKVKILNQKRLIEKKYNIEIKYLNIPILDISSTMIKDKIKKQEQVNYLLPFEVWRYIKKFNLYK